jgi:hypothetical protein
MATQERRNPDEYPPDTSGWAVGGATFAACMIMIIGVFQLISALQAIINDDFFVVGRNYSFNLDTSAWGWIHLVIAIVMIATAWGLFTRAQWAGVVAIFIVSLSAIANFFFIPYYPFWSILVIALDVWVIWAITRPGVLRGT